jgi:predicted ATPase/DNA-binding winged helix-turn-helix (wHTH) protein
MGCDADRLGEEALAFGPFRLFRRAKLLTESGRPVRIGSRALEILTTLVEQGGRVVSKNELISRVWSSTVVEETNLRVNLHGLRKILGDGRGGARYIVNVAGRGYQFVAPVTTVNAAPRRAPIMQRGIAPLPGRATRAVGRDDVIQDLFRESAHKRLITILGPGGIGKSTVALALAERLAEDGMQSVCFVDLTAVDDPTMVPTVIAGALGLSLMTDNPIAGLISYLQDVRLTLVIDNCEHVIGDAATVTERILVGAPLIRVVATSREPLMIEGERLFQLAPLRTPDEVQGLTSTTALSYSAVQLFVERALGGEDGFELTDGNAAPIATICQRLDGLPLAIELVAARANLLDIHRLWASVDEELFLQTPARRDSRSRHRSLQAALDWSYRNLRAFEQLTLRRLSSFRGLFTLQAAYAVLGLEVGEGDVREAVTSLVSKSLLMTDVGGPSLRFRLLYTTRTYAIGKLTTIEERGEALRQHAIYHRDLLESSLSEWGSLTRHEWQERFGELIEDVRAALEWAFSPAGDLKIGATLMAASIPYGFPLLPATEFKRRAAIALQQLSDDDLARRPWAQRLHLTLAAFLYHTGASREEALANIDRAVALATMTGTLHYRLEPMASRVAHTILSADYPDAVRRVCEVIEVAKQAEEPMGQLLADRIAAQALHFNGDLRQSKKLAAAVLGHPGSGFPLAYDFGDLYVDRRVSMRIILARNLWLEGFGDQAAHVAADAVELAGDDSNPNTIIQSLALAACPIAFWRGDLSQASLFTERLVYEARRFSFERWLLLARFFEAALARLRTPDSDSLGRFVDPMRYASILHRELLGTIIPDWVDQELIDRAVLGSGGWCRAELLRVQGLRMIKGNSAEGETILWNALESARNQGALSWELRCAVSLAKCGLDRRGTAERLGGLSEVYNKFTEGFDSVDLAAARGLLGRSGNVESIHVHRHGT